jgi:signal transduction histidine kinase
MRLYQFIPRRLWQQIFLLFLGLMIIPLVILGSLLTRTSQKIIKDTVERDLKQIVLHTIGEVLKEYEGAYQALDAAAAILGTLHADVWRQETATVELSLKYPSFRHLCTVDLKGQPIACSDSGEFLSGQIKADLLDCVLQQSRCVSQVRSAPDYVPVMDIAVPVRRYGKVEGMLVAEYNLRGIWAVVDQIQFGGQSRAILVDRYGRILAHYDKKEVLKNNTFFYPQVIDDLAGGKNATRMGVDPQGRRWIMAYSPIDFLGWGLIVAQPYDQAFASVNLMNYHSWIIIVLSLFLAGLIAFIIAQWVSRPMHELIQATRRLARGDLSVSLPIRGRDEINQLKYAFNHMTVRLKKARQMERLSIVGKSAASIAHELKNSLVLVKTFVQLIPQRHKEKAFVQEATETINRELDGWNAMLRNMMDFAREQMPLQLSSLNLNALIEETVLLTKIRAQEHQVILHVQTDEILPLIQADGVRLKQVLVNLIANAFEATPLGGEISVRTFSDGTAPNVLVGFEVSNSGMGIAKEDLIKIFDPFFTTKDTGLGLGLAICRDIVHRHGGRLEAHSQTGKETVFRVLLPVYGTDTLERGAHDLR